MNNFEAIKNMSVDEFARFLATILGQGEIYGETTCSDYRGRKMISGSDAFNNGIGRWFEKTYKEFLESESPDGVVSAPDIKY